VHWGHFPFQQASNSKLRVQRAGHSVSNSWVTRFLHRHKAELVTKWAAGKYRNCYKADSGASVEAYFTLLHSKIAEYSVEPQHTYNMDEKGFIIGVLARTGRVFSRPLRDGSKLGALSKAAHGSKPPFLLA
jgi:hypothetical protein